MPADAGNGTYPVPARDVPVPAHLSPVARMYLAQRPPSPPYPEFDDKTGWQAYVAAVDQAVLPLLQQIDRPLLERHQLFDDAFGVEPAGAPSMSAALAARMRRLSRCCSEDRDPARFRL